MLVCPLLRDGQDKPATGLADGVDAQEGICHLWVGILFSVHFVPPGAILPRPAELGP
jgi:hypothetical protein